MGYGFWTELQGDVGTAYWTRLGMTGFLQVKSKCQQEERIHLNQHFQKNEIKKQEERSRK